MSAQTAAAQNLLGHQIESSATIQQQIDSLVETVMSLNRHIQGVRPPQGELKGHLQMWLDQAAAVRGRPLYFPFVGTGAGRGCYVELEDGSVKMDLVNGIGVHLMGHSHPRVIAAGIRGSLSDVVNQGNLQPNKEYIRFLQKITSLAGKNSRLKYGWLATCGTMANENALKISRQKRNAARMVLCFQNAFAGRSTLMAELTDNPAYKQGLPDYNEMLRLPFFDPKDPNSGAKTLAKMKEYHAQHGDNICCFSFEPMLGEGGYIAAPHEFFKPLLDFCKDKKIPVWADEVQTFARTGEMFAFETLGFGDYVDLCTIAKTAQVAVTLYTQEMNPNPGLIAGTFSGTSAALSAGLEVLQILEEDYLGKNGRIQKIHSKFVGMLNELNQTTCKGLLQDAGGLGLMIAVTPMEGKKEQVEAILKKMFEKGVIAYSCGKSPVRIRFLIPAVIEDQDIAAAKKIIEESILEIK